MAIRTTVEDRGRDCRFADKGTAAGRYRADITAGSLKVAQSRIIADLLLRGLDEAGWKLTITKDNVLKAKNPATSIRLTRL